MEATRRNRIVLALGILAVVLAGVVAVVVAGSDDEETTTTDSTTTTSVDVTSSTSSSTTSTSSPPTSTTPTGPSDEEAVTIVWPEPGGEPSYDDPMVAARGFAERLIGFDDPVYGEFQQGDSRSGEVEIRPLADGPVTTVLVRQMSDDHWYVIGAASSELELDDPAPGSAIDHPLQVSGRARAFEGQVRVAVYQRGDTTPLGEGFVTASGTSDLGPFAGEVSWDNPGGGWGSVVLTTAGGEDGSIWAAIAVPVGFIGGD